MVHNGELGRKTGKGFYVWKDGKPQKMGAITPSAGPQSNMAPGAGGAGQPPASEMADRLILPMVNVCVACLREGIVDNADVVDGAMIFGTGFAPFRGGPLNYARSRGKADIVATLQGLAGKYGDRFKPDAGWDQFT
jgi:3-hydroxyacyl-CoA dehydrogenase/enoyl-CoA hydratase/3-hydroxybutyryl-CoA epimerase